MANYNSHSRAFTRRGTKTAAFPWQAMRDPVAMQRLMSAVERMERLTGPFRGETPAAAADVSPATRRKRSSLLAAYADKLATKMELNGQERTAKAYRTAARGLARFNHKDVRLEQITAPLMVTVEQAMKEKGLMPNTISFYMRNLRAIYNKAVREKQIAAQPDNPFAGVYTGIATTGKRALTADELQLLDALDTSLTGGKANHKTEQLPAHLRTSLAFFLFCFHARGMSYVDMAYLRKSNIKDDVITYFRKKTGRPLQVKITGQMRRLLDYFAPMTAGSPYVFPVIADPEKSPRLQYESGLRMQNEHLKSLARLAGIGKTLSTHVARHTWATCAHNADYPLAVISQALGHADEKTTYTYLRQLEQSRIDTASEFISQAVKKAG